MKILRTSTSGESSRLLDRRLRGRNEVGAVDEVVRVVANDSEFGHRALEVVHHQLLVVDHALPLARGALVAGERKVGLETHLALSGEWRVDFCTFGVVNAEGNAGTLKQHFKEDLGVEGERRGIERNSGVAGNESV